MRFELSISLAALLAATPALAASNLMTDVAHGGTGGHDAASARWYRRGGLRAMIRRGLSVSLAALLVTTPALAASNLIVDPAHGGTGGHDAASARAGIGAAASGANGDITSLSGLTTPLSTAQGGSGGTGGVGGTPFASTGGSSLLSSAARWSQILNVLDGYGGTTAYRDKQVVFSTVSITSGQNALYCASCNFTQQDATSHKYIVVYKAGPTQTTGAVTAVALTSGGSYTTPHPNVVFSGAPTTALTGLPVAATISSLSTATTATNGVCPANITSGSNTYLTLQPFASQGGATGGLLTAPQIKITTDGASPPNVTVVGVNLAGSIWNSDTFGATGVQFTGGGCITAPTFNLTFTTSLIVMKTGGFNNPLSGITAAPSSGGATYGTVTVTPGILPLGARIQTYVDAQHVTLDTNASTTVSGSVEVKWMDDDGPAIQGAWNAACAASNSQGVYFQKGIASVFLPGSGWGIATNLTIPDNCNLNFFGSGPGISEIDVAAALGVDPTNATCKTGTNAQPSSLSSAIFKCNSNGNLNFHDFTVDGNHLVTVPLWLHGANGALLWNMNVFDAAPTVAGGADVIFGDPFTYTYVNGVSMHDFVVRDLFPQNITSDLPLWGIANYSADNVPGHNVSSVGAAIANYYTSGDGYWGSTHGFNASVTQQPQYNYYLAGSAVLMRPYADSAAVSGFYITGAARLVAPNCFWNTGPQVGADCVQIASGTAGAIVEPVSIQNPGFPGANAVLQQGTANASTQVQGQATGVVGASYQTPVTFPAGGFSVCGICGPYGDGLSDLNAIGQLEFVVGGTGRGLVYGQQLMWGPGTGSKQSVNNNSGNANGVPLIQVTGALTASPAANSIGVFAFTNSTAYPASLYLAQSNTSTGGVQAAVASGSQLGQMVGDGSDGSHFQDAGAFRVLSDSAWTVGTTPGRASIWTATSGGTLTEALRLDSSQNATFFGTIKANATTTGTPAASLCLDASGNIIKKTTAGSCI